MFRAELSRCIRVFPAHNLPSWWGSMGLDVNKFNFQHVSSHKLQIDTWFGRLFNVHNSFVIGWIRRQPTANFMSNFQNPTSAWDDWAECTIHEHNIWDWLNCYSAAYIHYIHVDRNALIDQRLINKTLCLWPYTSPRGWWLRKVSEIWKPYIQQLGLQSPSVEVDSKSADSNVTNHIYTKSSLIGIISNNTYLYNLQ